MRPEEFSHKKKVDATPEKSMDNQQDAIPGIETVGRLPTGQSFGNEKNPLVAADQTAYGQEKHSAQVQAEQAAE